jgi:hypothetical protein
VEKNGVLNIVVITVTLQEYSRPIRIHNQMQGNKYTSIIRTVQTAVEAAGRPNLHLEHVQHSTLLSELCRPAEGIPVQTQLASSHRMLNIRLLNWTVRIFSFSVSTLTPLRKQGGLGFTHTRLGYPSLFLPRDFKSCNK